MCVCGCFFSLFLSLPIARHRQHMVVCPERNKCENVDRISKTTTVRAKGDGLKFINCFLFLLVHQAPFRAECDWRVNLSVCICFFISFFFVHHNARLINTSSRRQVLSSPFDFIGLINHLLKLKRSSYDTISKTQTNSTKKSVTLSSLEICISIII